MSDVLPDITINLSDPDDVRAQLPAVQLVAVELRRQADELVERAARWDHLVSALEALAPEQPTAESDDHDQWGNTSTDDAVAGMDEVVTRPTMAEITEFIGEETDPGIVNESVGSSWPMVDGLFAAS